MRTIRIEEPGKNPTLINPRAVTQVQLVEGTVGDFCITIDLVTKEMRSISRPTRESAEETFNYIEECLV